MAKTITLRVEDTLYSLFKNAASGERRTISNFLENAALHYLVSESAVSDSEMEEILKDKLRKQKIRERVEEV